MSTVRSGKSVSLKVGTAPSGTVMRVSAGIDASNTVPTSSTALRPGKKVDGQRMWERDRVNPGTIVTAWS